MSAVYQVSCCCLLLFVILFNKSKKKKNKEIQNSINTMNGFYLKSLVSCSSIKIKKNLLIGFKHMYIQNIAFFIYRPIQCLNFEKEGRIFFFSGGQNFKLKSFTLNKKMNQNLKLKPFYLN